MASPNPSSSGFPPTMGPGARPLQPGDGPRSMISELQEIRSTYFIKVDPDTLHLGYNFRGANRKYDIPFASMPLSDGSRWLLYGGESRARVSGLFALDLIRGAENMAGRPLTQQEAEAFAFHTGKRMKYNYWGTLAGFATGYLIAARTWKTMRFPFRKAKPLESYDYFPGKRLPLLKGQYSRIMWQITRANVYAAISLIFAQTIFGSMGDSVMTVGLYRDMRTQEVVKAVKGGFDRIRMNRAQPGQAPPVAQQQQGHDSDPAGQDFYPNEATNASDFYGKSSNYGGDQPFPDSTTETGMDDAAMSRSERQRDTKQYQYSAPQPPQSSSNNKPGSDFFFDDASPTAGNGPDMGTSQPYQSNSGSTWDSIRKGQGRPQPSSSSQPRQSSSQSSQQMGGWRGSSSSSQSSGGDSFSFSKGDEERQLAKQQAQRDFDAMLEKERREGGSESYANSSYAAESGAEVPQSTGGSAWGRRRGGGS